MPRVIKSRQQQKFVFAQARKGVAWAKKRVAESTMKVGKTGPHTTKTTQKHKKKRRVKRRRLGHRY